jgi:phosphoadenosine phosphosulfate reductase
MILREKYTHLVFKYEKFFNEKNTVNLLKEIAGEGKAVFSSSFGKEDQVITDILVKEKISAKIFTIDTGRLFNETYSLHRKTNDIYKIKIATFFPDSKEVEDLINKKGPDSFFDSVENRLECCRIRKVNPLKRALNGSEIWITGLRHEQSGDRAKLEMIQFDEEHLVIKFHPLLNWSSEDIDDYIKKNKVPVNILHDKGFPSIGCSPCTREVFPGEDSRAGRWSWETGKKECGLHIKQNNK